MKKFLHLMIVLAIAVLAIGCASGSSEDSVSTPPSGGEVAPDSPASATPSAE
jgi:ABC-type molybdate transport system substrate-binding protein